MCLEKQPNVPPWRRLAIAGCSPRTGQGGRRRVLFDGSEQTGLGQFRRKRGVFCVGVVARNGVDRAAVVVEEIKFAILIFAEGDDAHQGARDLWHLLDAVAFEAGGPKAPRFPIAEDVGAAQLGKFLAAIDAPAGNAASDRVRNSISAGTIGVGPILCGLIGCGPSIADQP